LDFLHRLQGRRRLVVLYLHPTEPYHIGIMPEVCQRRPFVRNGRVGPHPGVASRWRSEGARSNLGGLAEKLAA